MLFVILYKYITYNLLYKCFVFAGKEDFLSNIVHLCNVGLMLGQRRRRWTNIKTTLGEYSLE